MSEEEAFEHAIEMIQVGYGQDTIRSQLRSRLDLLDPAKGFDKTDPAGLVKSG